MISKQTIADIEQGNPPNIAWICHEEPTDEPLIWYRDNPTTNYVIKACLNEHPDLPCGWYGLVALTTSDIIKEYGKEFADSIKRLKST